MSSCCFNNAENPNAPEYQKAHKPENNAGCSCSCSVAGEDSEEEVTLETTVVVSNKTREDYL